MATTPAGALEWYAVKVSLSRTGRTVIYYVQAPSGQAAAQAYPGGTLLGGPYSSEAAAQAAFPGGSAGTTAPATGQAPTTSLAPASPLSGLSGLAAIGGFFSALGQPNTWIRVAEVIIGVALVAIGVASLTHAVPIATSIAKAVK